MFTKKEVATLQYYQLPKFILMMDINHSSMILYLLMFDRLKLSLKNNFFDEDGNAFIFMDISEIMKSLNISKQKAVKIKKELMDKELIIIKKTIAKDRIYVQNPLNIQSNLERYITEYENHTLDKNTEYENHTLRENINENTEYENHTLIKKENAEYENHTFESMKIIPSYNKNNISNKNRKNRIERITEFKFSNTKFDYSELYSDESFFLKHKKANMILNYIKKYTTEFENIGLFLWDKNTTEDIVISKYLTINQQEELESFLISYLEESKDYIRFLSLLEYYITLMKGKSAKYIEKVINTIVENKIMNSTQLIEFISNVQEIKNLKRKK